MRRRRGWGVHAALAGSAALVHGLQLWGGFSSPHHWDEVRIALPAAQILGGTLPIHQVGVDYYGATAAYPLAVWFAVTGPSALALDLFSVLVATGVAWTGYLVARRFLPGRPALLAGLVFAAPPLFLARWAMTGNLNYPVNLLIGNLVLLGTHTVVFRRRRGPAALFVLGLVAGIGWWNNPMIVVYCAPFALLALRTGLLRRLPFWLFPLGVLVGGSPDFAYEVAQYPSSRLALHHAAHGEEERLGNRVATLLRAAPDLVGARDALAPVTFRPPTAVQGAVLALGLLAVGRAVVRDRAELRWLVGAGGRPGAGLGALWALVVAVLAVTLPTDRHLRTSYFIPFHGVLPLWLGELLGWLWTVRRGLGAALAAGVVAYNLFAGLSVVRSQRRPAWRWARLEARVRPLANWLAARGIRHVYYDAPLLRAMEVPLLTGMRVIAADLVYEPVVQHGWQVDAQPAPPIVTAPDRVPALRESLGAIGYAVRETAVGRFRVLEPGRVHATGFAPIAADRWTVAASHRAFEAGHLVDRDAATQWSTGEGQTPGQWLGIDLGREEDVTRLDLLAIDWRELPAGFRVDWSRDGVAWQEAVSVPSYRGPLFAAEGHPFERQRRGRVQAVFGPVRARHLRVVQTGRTGRAWSARELFVYRPAPPRPRPPGAAELVEALRRQGVTMVYASHWLSARVLASARGAVAALDSNLYWNSYGRERPPPVALERFRLEPGHAVLIGPDADAAGIRRALAAVGGLGREAAAGPYPLILLSPPRARPALPSDGWRATAGVPATEAARAVDGDRRTRWTAPGPPAGDTELVVDLGAARRVGGLRLRPGSGDGGPSAFALEGSTDGDAWRRLEPLTWIGPLYWTGYELLRNGAAEWAVAFPPATLRHLRIRPAAPGRHWAVGEIEVLG